MKFYIVLIVLFIFSTAVASNSSECTNENKEEEVCSEEPKFSVFAYLPEWRYEGAYWNGIFEIVTHLLLFSLEMADSGKITAKDRIPRKELLLEIFESAKQHHRKVMICFGGNGRSKGFSKMVESVQSRKKFISELVDMIEHYGFDGVDYNWEYPGYKMGVGYSSQKQIFNDYKGLSLLVKETRDAFDKINPHLVITMAYYPDELQEMNIQKHKIADGVDFMHIMAYDQHGSHSTYSFAKKVAKQAIKLGLPPEKVTLGLPFYGRNSKSGEWVTYEDIVQNYVNEFGKLPSYVDTYGDLHFNGRGTITKKTNIAKELGLGGVMIWEVGQDCRQQAVKHGVIVHVKTCPEGDENMSLLKAI